MAAIFYREFATGSAPLLTLAGEEYLRPLGIGSSWSVLKIGLVCAVTTNGTSNLTDVNFFMGVCSGTVQTYASGFVLAAAGMRTVAGGSLTYSTSSSRPYYSYSGVTTRWDNNVETAPAPTAGHILPAIKPMRSVVGVIINKASATLVTHVYTANASILMDMRNMQIMSDFMDMPAGGNLLIEGTSYVITAAGSALAYSEFAPWDTLDIYWSKAAFPLEIYGIAVSRLA